MGFCLAMFIPYLCHALALTLIYQRLALTLLYTNVCTIITRACRIQGKHERKIRSADGMLDLPPQSAPIDSSCESSRPDSGGQLDDDVTDPGVSEWDAIPEAAPPAPVETMRQQSETGHHAAVSQKVRSVSCWWTCCMLRGVHGHLHAVDVVGVASSGMVDLELGVCDGFGMAVW